MTGAELEAYLDGLDDLADYGLALADRVRDESPVEVLGDLLAFIEAQPLRTAQLLMVFAIWLDPIEFDTGMLKRRQESVARSRVAHLRETA